jgi:DNA-binding MarR family transcriptional regulator
MTHSGIPFGDLSLSRRCIGPVDDPRDARVKLLALTQEGQRKSEEIGDFISELHQEILLEIQPDHRMTVLSSLELLRSSLEAIKRQLR